MDGRMDKWMNGWMNGWMDGRMNEWTDGWMNKWTDGWMDGRMNGRMNEWMNGWMNGWMDGRMNGWMHEWMNGWTGGWMNGWMDGWMNAWKDEWMDGRMDGWTNGYVNGWMDGWIDILLFPVLSFHEIPRQRLVVVPTWWCSTVSLTEWSYWDFLFQGAGTLLQGFALQCSQGSSESRNSVCSAAFPPSPWPLDFERVEVVTWRRYLPASTAYGGRGHSMQAAPGQWSLSGWGRVASTHRVPLSHCWWCGSQRHLTSGEMNEMWWSLWERLAAIYPARLILPTNVSKSWSSLNIIKRKSWSSL